MPNRLAYETSPYLRQHADNPVDWYAWGDEALQRARELDMPILLSIGYSACHWCHVMAHESFEDAAVAAKMNELFVNIKVDREERPDLDQIYQTAQAMLTQRTGGWPLTMFLTPDQMPFFGGTYFPKTARHGLPGFLDLLPQVAAAYREKRAQIGEQSGKLRTALEQTMAATSSGGTLTAAPLASALRELQRIFDSIAGGLGDAPKFPHPVELEFCLRRSVSGDTGARNIVELTLSRMAEGGIYDQLGGGFSRYSVDAQWVIPHFEKMLYDNAPLLRLYRDLWLITHDPRYERIVAETAAWVMREMQSPEGGYYSSIDADSEHEEGKFYVWTPDQVRAALSAEEYAVVAPHYGLDAPPNFEGRAWHLRIMKPLPVLANRLTLTPERVSALLASGRAKLLNLREQRVRPGRDEKILTSWNALMIKGMAHAARVFDNPQWLASARAAMDFLHTQLWRGDAGGRLLATYKDGRAHLNAYLDDYAFLIDALLELVQADGRLNDLAWGRELADALLEQFEDRTHGGFFFVSHDHEPLILRTKSGHDNATPAGNGIAAFGLQRLGYVLGETRYIEAAQRALQAFAPLMERQASAHTSLCVALEEHFSPPTTIILRGDDATPWQRALAARYLPHVMVFAIPAGAGGIPAALDKPLHAQLSAWVCPGTNCLPPITTLDELLAVIQK